jgi:hypothetical protein
MMFQPRPRLIKAADGSYTLLVAVQVPSFCYRAGTVTPGLPDGGIGIPEIEYFTLEIIHDDDVVCAQLVHDIMFVQTGIRPNSGKYAVGVVAVLDGKPVGSGLVTLPEDGKGKAARRESLPPGVVLLPDSVSAAVFGGFTGITTLHVSASVLTPTSGYRLGSCRTIRRALTRTSSCSTSRSRRRPGPCSTSSPRSRRITSTAHTRDSSRM